ncbi:MAG TPA: hypothetical protein VJH22_07275 [Candidatus Nanoarchaeia archaeon]|nr:hypothetical protein [Candidatus Nanoarchaeia archaeon]
MANPSNFINALRNAYTFTFDDASKAYRFSREAVEETLKAAQGSLGIARYVLQTVADRSQGIVSELHPEQDEDSGFDFGRQTPLNAKKGAMNLHLKTAAQILARSAGDMGTFVEGYERHVDPTSIVNENLEF